MRPSWAQRLPWDIITDQARRLSMEACLIAAVIQKESSGIAWKTRFEPGFKWVLEPGAYAKSLDLSLATELSHQMTSWGMMQIMGGTAREMGFRGYFPQLCADAALGINFATRYLKKQLEKNTTMEAALAAYNAGSALKDETGTRFANQPYVDAVMQFYRELVG